MPRYATIITADDGAEIVSAIGEFEGASLPRHNAEQVAPGVRIGMVRGGPGEAVAGFGFPGQLLDPSAVRAATMKLKAMATPAAGKEPAKPARAKKRKRPARKPRKTRTAKAAPSDAQG